MWYNTHMTNTRVSELDFHTATTTRLSLRLAKRSFSISRSGEIETLKWMERWRVVPSLTKALKKSCVSETESPSAFSERLCRMISYLEYSCIQRLKSQEIKAFPITIQVRQAGQARKKKSRPAVAVSCACWWGNWLFCYICY